MTRQLDDEMTQFVLAGRQSKKTVLHALSSPIWKTAPGRRNGGQSNKAYLLWQEQSSTTSHCGLMTYQVFNGSSQPPGSAREASGLRQTATAPSGLAGQP